MIQISITLQILANIIPEILWTLILQALSAMIHINKKENQKTIVKDVLSFGTSQAEVALHFHQCVQDEKLLCGGSQSLLDLFVEQLLTWLQRALGMSVHSVFEINLQDQDLISFHTVLFWGLGGQYLQCKLGFLERILKAVWFELEKT